ncbi:acyl-coenzyme A synthetase ACSM4, mitochondrial-like [Oculina patagonica]
MADAVIWGTKDFQVPEYFNFADVIDEWAEKEKKGTRKSDYPALWWIDGIDNEVKWSFQDVALKSKKTANLLSKAADIKPGDRVMVVLPTIPEYWLIQAACLRTGGVLIVTPNNLGPVTFQQRILMAKPVCIVMAPCDQIPSEYVDVINQVTDSGQVNIRSRIVINRMKDEKWDGWLSFEDLFETASTEFQSVKSLSSAPTNMFYTAGTSGGNLKMAEHCHASMGLGSAGMQMCRFEETDLSWTGNTSPGWSWLLLDNFHSTWSVGAGTFAHYRKATAREFLEALQKYPITKYTSLYCTFMNALHEEDLESFRFPTLKRCYTAGEPTNKNVLRKWKEVTGIELWDYYGQTELAVITMPRKPGDDEQLFSAGKALPGIDMIVVDDNWQEVPPGTLGRVVIRVKPYRPVNMLTCYTDNPEKTAALYHGDFYLTGDLGRMDAEGHFWITGRADEIIFAETADNVNPFEVEDILNEHPAVQTCAVVSSPHLGGQTIKAFVVLSPGFKDKNQDKMIKELQEYVKYNSASYMCPKKMEFVDDLPKTLVDKIDRRTLTNREWNGVISA